ncbi:MAG: protein-disulfide reductase DsbD family protein [Planctomycetota bacterium]
MKQEGYANVSPGQSFDLLVTIDPKGDRILDKGLRLEPQPATGIEFHAPLLPPEPEEGSFAGPFVVRIPVTLKGSGKIPLVIKVTGKLKDGKELSLEAKSTLYSQPTTGHIQGEASLRAPAEAGKPNAVVLKLEVIEGYHVYGAKVREEEGLPMEAELLPARGAGRERLWSGGGATPPPGHKYYGDFTFEVPFTPLKEGKVDLRVLLRWQACTEEYCDPDELAYLPMSFDVAPGEGPVIQQSAGEEATETGSSAGRPDLEGAGLLELALLAIGGALFALAMPCTYPLIPITISFFTKQAEAQHHKVVPLAMAYGAGIVVIFTLVGVIFGDPILAFATLWWVNAIFALLFLVFGLSLIGLFDIRLPGFFNDIAAKATGTGGYLSVFAMGTTLVITSFTCTAPIVGLILVWAAAGGSLWKVGFTMAVFGLTMAIPFVFLSLSPKAMQKMPRSGEWMKTLKVTLGIVELGLVLKFVSNMDLAFETNLIGRELFLALWGLSFLAAGLYLLDVFGLLSFRSRWSIGKGRLISGVLLLVITGYLASGLGGRRLGKNLEAFLPDLDPTYTDGFLAVAKEDFEKGVETATRLGAPIFLDFTGFQ